MQDTLPPSPTSILCDLEQDANWIALLFPPVDQVLVMSQVSQLWADFSSVFWGEKMQ